ncbi:hypothetical protein ABH923_000315 [Leifsonia sp. EB41]|uniref:hypothetical protein n=1 Tax=Leifsonia sp. EB41 TaxID=3156260 RepID=UPI003514EB23
MKDERPNRGIGEDLALIRAHDGHIMSMANRLDERLIHPGEWFTDGDMSDRSRPAWIAMKPGEKLRALARVMPKDWRDGEMLRDRTKRCMDYRNVLGHGTPEFRFAGDGSTTWERKSMRGAEPIDISSFHLWETRFAVVEASWKLLIYPGSLWMADSGLKPDQIGLPELVRSDAPPPADPESTKEWLRVVRWVFPPAK